VNYPEVETWLRRLQIDIVAGLVSLDDNPRLCQNRWERREGGGGITRTIEGDGMIEKGAVNFSAISGNGLPPAASALHPALSGYDFHAAGVSVIVHPRNPYVPASHFNLRFFLAEKPGIAPVWWFGGGFDLTPCYGFEQDCRHWHRTARAACTPFGDDIYPRFKRWCDEYFYLPHRGEARGIGGIFFDDLNEWGFERCFRFVRAVGEHYLPAYLPIFEHRKTHPWGERERAFQLYRRGRYVEFNLIYDRGTRFGLQSDGRVESVLASLPPEAHWRYDWRPAPGSPEDRLTAYFLKPRDWLAGEPR